MDTAVPRNVLLYSIFGGLVALSILTMTTTPNHPVMVEEHADLGIDTGSEAWMLVSCAFVLLMTPGVGFFFGGMVRPKNVLSTIMQSYITMGLVSVLWVFVGFSLAFGESVHGLFGNPSTYFLFRNVGAAPDLNFAPGISLTTYAVYQMMFAVITPALITGSFSERIHFHSLCFFMVFWVLLVYCPIAHAVWHPAGFLRTWPTIDFAGGTAVHMASGWSSLVGAVYLGQRKEDPSEVHEPASVAYTMLGTALVWVGWFGFNGGSALSSGALASQAMLNTHIAAATAMCTWIFCDMARNQKLKASGACCGALIGLCTITPAAGFVNTGGAMCMAIIGAISVYGTQCLMHHYGFNLYDQLDVFLCHGIGGTVGFLLTGLFAAKQFYSHDDGLLYGNPVLFVHHLITVPIVIGYTCTMTFFLCMFVDFITPLKPSLADEIKGMDASQHGEAHMHTSYSRKAIITQTRNVGSFNKVRSESDLPAQRTESNLPAHYPEGAEAKTTSAVSDTSDT